MPDKEYKFVVNYGYKTLHSFPVIGYDRNSVTFYSYSIDHNPDGTRLMSDPVPISKVWLS